jgi:hypothetical protein
VTQLWAGKRLSPDEELRTRRLIALMRRTGNVGQAEELERFMPENDHRWTPDELEFGAHVGPWLEFDAELDVAADDPEEHAA